MLILSRKVAECIHLGDDIVLTIVTIGNDKVKIGVQAPPGVKVLRTELEVDAALPLRIAPLTQFIKAERKPEASEEVAKPAIRRAA